MEDILRVLKDRLRRDGGQTSHPSIHLLKDRLLYISSELQWRIYGHTSDVMGDKRLRMNKKGQPLLRQTANYPYFPIRHVDACSTKYHF
jgi:hypothetical protein